MGILRYFLLVVAFSALIYAAGESESLVVTTTEILDSKGTADIPDGIPSRTPKIYQMHVFSAVSNRYANTTVISKVKNLANTSQEATFTVVLPETAFISGFVMEVAGKNYTAYVKEKEEAKKTYDEAVASGLSAAHVAVSARDSNRFTVSVNVEPETKAAFYLNYEELLNREDGHYELVINLHPGQPVKDLNVQVVLNESRKIVNLRTPPLRSGNEIGAENAELDPRADIRLINDTSATVQFTPTLENQKQLAHLLQADGSDGLAGQFVVQYDVERDPTGGEVLVQDGYFVHFFAPTEVKPLPKHVVFVLDTSYSMAGEKIGQLREAMEKILGELKSDDWFNLVEFNTNVKVWDLDDHNASVWYPTENGDAWRTEESDEDLAKYSFPSVYSATADNIKKAKATASHLEPNGGTDIHNALLVGLHLVELAKNQTTSSPQPMIIFLTDGEPTIGITEIDQIIAKISDFNAGLRKSPIFALSFGDGADKAFLQKLSTLNSGFSRHIYEAADASLQLQDFYRQISSPLLTNVSFKYEPSVTSLTNTQFPIHFDGSEIVVAGWCGTDLLNLSVDGWGIEGSVHLVPVVERSVSNVERLWAYLSIKQLLEQKEASDKDSDKLKEKALKLALKYSFVTPVSSLVVVKPNDTSAVDTEAAEKTEGQRFLPYAQSLTGAAPYNGGAIPLSGTIGLKYNTAFLVDDRISGGAALTFDAPYDEVEMGDLEEIDYEKIASTTFASDNTTELETKNLLGALPWLNDVLNENGEVHLPSGEYRLGLNETITDIVECPTSLSNTTGHCKLLNACSEVNSLLKSFDMFVQHSCILKEQYAGICCSISPGELN